MLFLGWNELMAVLWNPVFLIGVSVIKGCGQTYLLLGRQQVVLLGKGVSRGERTNGLACQRRGNVTPCAPCCTSLIL